MPREQHGTESWEASRQRVNADLERHERSLDDNYRDHHAFLVKLAVLETKALLLGGIGGVLVMVVIQFLSRRL